MLLELQLRVRMLAAPMTTKSLTLKSSTATPEFCHDERQW
jgi:hypothetical protein